MGRDEMKIFFSYLSKDKTILEFGCGPGKNLFGIAELVKGGYGIDVNHHYIRIAKKLAGKYTFDWISHAVLSSILLILETYFILDRFISCRQYYLIRFQAF